MKKIAASLLILLLGTFLMAGNAMAIFISPAGHDTDFNGTGNEDSLQTVMDKITLNGPSSVDFVSDTYFGDENDALDDSIDSYWDITGSGGSVSTMIIEIAGYAAQNTFGVYDRADYNNYQQLFDGASSNRFPNSFINY